MHSNRLRSVGLLAATLALLGACDRLPSDSGIPGEPSSSAGAAAPAADDAQAYAATYGVSLDEARSRLALQRAVGALNTRLRADHPQTFAGLSIEHQPEFRVVARFTRNGEQALRSAGMDPALARVVRTERAAVPLLPLRRRTEVAYERVRAAGIEATAVMNVRENRPEVHVLAGSEAAARAVLGAGVAVVVVSQLPRREVQIYGGLPVSACTSGYSVQNASGTTGVTTAGHCNNSQSYAGYALTFLGEAWYGSYDIQWHTRAGDTFDPIIKVASGTRTVTGTKSVSQQVAGEWVCKQGATTGYTCGTLNSTTYCFSGACTWVYVTGGSVNLSEGGDSGGPWFSGNTAYGTHVFGGGNDSGYMPIDYLSQIGVTVRTGTLPPPPPPLSAGIYGADQVPFGTWCYYSGWASGGVAPYSYGWISVGGLDDEWWSDNQYGVLTSDGYRSIEMWMTVRDASGQYLEIMKMVDKNPYASC